MSDALPKVQIAPGTKPVYSAGLCASCDKPLERGGWIRVGAVRVCDPCRLDYIEKVRER